MSILDNGLRAILGALFCVALLGAAECPTHPTEPEEPPSTPVVVTCDEFCEMESRAAFEDCVADGGSEDRCRSHANDVYNECLASNCPVDTDPPVDPTCQEGCEARATAAYEDCIADGGSEDRCRSYAADLYNDCVANNCDDVPPPPDDATCQDRCEARSTQAYEDCIANGRPEDQCTTHASDIYNDCMTANCSR